MNKKLLSLALAVSVALGMVGSALAIPGKVPTKRDQKGEGAHPLYGGYLHMRNSATAELPVCSGRCLLAGLIMSTGAPTSLLTIRNTSVGNGTGVIVLEHYFVAMNTEPGNNPIRLPIVLDKGISATLSSVTNSEEVTILYEDLDNE